MSKKTGKAMKNMPRSYVYAMEQLQAENADLKVEVERLREGVKNYLIELKQGVTDLYPPNIYIEKFEQLLNPSDG